VEGAPGLTTYPKNVYANTLDERNVRVEKFIVLGLKNKPKSVKVEGTGEELVWDYIPGAGSAEKKGGMASLGAVSEAAEAAIEAVEAARRLRHRKQLKRRVPFSHFLHFWWVRV
jgi:hypothetical protein